MKTTATSHWTAAEHEAAFVKAFVISAKRAHVLELLGTPRRRKDILRTLDHFKDLDPSRMTPVTGAQDSPEGRLNLLQKLSAPEECYVISRNSQLDGRHMPLTEALDAVMLGGYGTLICCIPGQLAYYEADEQPGRYVLKGAKASAASPKTRTASKKK